MKLQQRIARQGDTARCASLIVLAASLTAACSRDDHQQPATAHANPTSDPAPTSTAKETSSVTNTSNTPLRLTDITAHTGIDMVVTAGETPWTQILQVNGSGLGLIDFDNDGDLDLFIANGASLADTENGPGSRLYENLGSLTFRDITAQSGIALKRWATGVAVADYDGDGFDDIYVTCFGKDVLLRNRGDGTFDDVTDAAGLGQTGWGTGCAWGDLDGDGDLDLYVVNYIELDPANPPPLSTYKGITVLPGPHGLIAQADFLYENLGDGTFRNRSENSGIRSVPASYGLGVIILDFDNDGRQDIYVGNDSQPNFLFRNDGDMTFTDIGMLSGSATNMDGAGQATMGIAVADIDGNGFPDLFSTNFSSDTNTLHLNVNGRFFDDRTQQYGLGMISRPYLGWSAGFFDFDHDGDEDLLLFNGHVYPQATMQSMDSEYRQPPLFFERNERRFAPVNPAVAGDWLTARHVDRAAVFADLDNDGDIDVVISEAGGPVRILRNDGAPPDRSIIITLHDNRPHALNHRAIGAHVELTAAGRVQRRWIHSGGYFQSSGAMIAHFGLPRTESSTPESASATVRWPDGITQTITNLQPGLRHVITRQ